jgi:hypothetical protein
MGIKEIDEGIISVYSCLKNGDISRVCGDELIKDLFAKKREILLKLSLKKNES